MYLEIIELLYVMSGLYKRYIVVHSCPKFLCRCVMYTQPNYLGLRAEYLIVQYADTILLLCLSCITLNRAVFDEGQGV